MRFQPEFALELAGVARFLYKAGFMNLYEASTSFYSVPLAIFEFFSSYSKTIEPVYSQGHVPLRNLQ